MPLEGVPFRMSATPPNTGGFLHRGPPLLGEDTGAVLRGSPRPDGRRGRGSWPRKGSCRDRSPPRGPGPRADRRVGRLLRTVPGRARGRRGEGRAGRRLAGPGRRPLSRRPGRREAGSPTGAWPSGPTTWESGRWWWPTTPRSSLSWPRPTSSSTPSAPARPRPGDLSYDALSADRRDLIVCAVTPFGQSGPWADYLADDLVLMALGGSMAACGYGAGADGVYDTPPLAAQGDQAWRTAATYAAIAILAGLAWPGPDGEPGGTGRGQFDRRLGPRVLGLHDRVAPDVLSLLGPDLPPVPPSPL